MTLREAAATLSLASSTLRRHIAAGRLRASRVPGPHGPERRISGTDLDAFVGIRRAAGFVWEGATRPVEEVTLNELLAWADTPQVRMAFLEWTRRAPSTTPIAVLQWIHERLQAERRADPSRGLRG